MRLFRVACGPIAAATVTCARFDAAEAPDAGMAPEGDAGSVATITDASSPVDQESADRTTGQDLITNGDFEALLSAGATGCGEPWGSEGYHSIRVRSTTSHKGAAACEACLNVQELGFTFASQDLGSLDKGRRIVARAWVQNVGDDFVEAQMVARLRRPDGSPSNTVSTRFSVTRVWTAVELTYTIEAARPFDVYVVFNGYPESARPCVRVDDFQVLALD